MRFEREIPYFDRPGVRPQGSLLGAFFTLLLYGALPLGLLLFIAGTPARRRMRHRAEAEAQQAPAPPGRAGG